MQEKNRVYGNRGNKCEHVGGMGVSALGMVLGLGNHVYGCGISQLRAEADCQALECNV